MLERRLGFLDLLIVALAVFAVAVRTPIGGIGKRAVAWATGDTTEQPALVSFFRNEAAQSGWVGDVPALPGTNIDHGTGLPEPYRSAVLHGLPKKLPPAMTTLLADFEGEPTARLLAWLDLHWAGDPEGAIERAAIGDELRDRAIERSRAAGDPAPESFAGHRRYLPAKAEKEAASVVNSILGLATVFDLRWPVDPTLRISSPFGYRIHPTLKTKKFHNGVDLPVPVGTPLHAAQSGKIKLASENKTSGKFVILQHGGGIQTTYCHMSELPAKTNGAKISKGEIIGKSGNTGRSTGPHLHFILRVNKEAIDPAPYRRVP